MKKLKIGIITHNFPGSENDRQNAGIFVYDFAKALSRKANIVVFSPGIKNRTTKIGNIETHFFEFNGKLGNLKIYNPFDFLNFVKFFIKGNMALEDFIRKNPDINFIISMWAFPSGYFAHKLFKSKNIPYLIYCLGSDIYIYAKKPILKNLIEKYLKNAKLLIADSPDLASNTEKISNKKTLFLPSSSNIKLVRSNKLNLTKGKITLTFLGRLEKVKGVDIFIDALENLKSEINNFNINIIGSGSLGDVIKEKITRIYNKNRIKIWGNINDQSKIIKILRSSDWTVIPSRSDSIPLVFSESMKSSIPVIVSDLPDLKYLVNKYKVGLMFKEGSVEALTKILKQLPKTRQLDFKSNTARAAEIFDLRKTSDKIISLIDKTL